MANKRFHLSSRRRVEYLHAGHRVYSIKDMSIAEEETERRFRGMRKAASSFRRVFMKLTNRLKKEERGNLRG
ncbi:hypothetical protein Ancab_013272 [Ancistrocladus abbreviatus]